MSASCFRNLAQRHFGFFAKVAFVELRDALERVDLLDRLVVANAHDAWKSQRVTAQMPGRDRKSTRLNSSHPSISYAVVCLKKKKNPNCNLLSKKKKNKKQQSHKKKKN